MASLKELMAQRAEIELKIAEAKRSEHAAAVAKIRDLMAEHGLTAADLAGRTAPAGRKGKAIGKVAVKYRDKSTGDAWTGRGLQPKWLRAALAAGRKIDDFKV